MEEVIIRPDAMKLTCSSCLALPGEGCRGLPEGDFHPERIDAAQFEVSLTDRSQKPDDVMAVTDKVIEETGLI